MDGQCYGHENRNRIVISERHVTKKQSLTHAMHSTEKHTKTSIFNVNKRTKLSSPITTFTDMTILVRKQKERG